MNEFLHNQPDYKFLPPRTNRKKVKIEEKK
jgi:hypothetical protein